MNTEVLVEVFDWVPDVGHSKGCYNQYMYIVDIYWHFKFLLNKFLMVKNENREDLLLSLDQMLWQMESMDRRIGHIEKHMAIPLKFGCSLGINKDPILVYATNSYNST